MISVQSSSDRIFAYLQMMRPANIVTAWADILAGYAVAGLVSLEPSLSSAQTLGWLLLSTTGLYGGGVVFNDVFDADLDAIERPERPIPSGRSSRQAGVLLGIGLLIIGMIAAAQVSLVSGVIAGAIAGAALLYDAFTKHHALMGSLNMGLCRGGNLLLGMSALSVAPSEHGWIAILPIVYIAAITLISRGEVNGGNSTTGIIAILLLVLVSAGLVNLTLRSSQSSVQINQFLSMLPFGLFWGISVFPAFIKATKTPSGEVIRAAVRAGVLSLIILDSAIAAGSSHWSYGLAILILLPISRLFARQFSVT
jgi:4-hydroxybenzoate polyprenyltransferase